MSAQILDLACARRLSPLQARESRPLGGQSQRAHDRERRQPERFKFWRGASKESYVHTIYNLIDCPDLPSVNYMLVRRDDDGRREVLQIGHTPSTVGSENLASIRHKAALLGANEVHVHYLTGSARSRNLVELDLRAGQFGALSAEPAAHDAGATLH